MACNYYYVYHVSDQVKLTIHIGKQSAGWRFLFRSYKTTWCLGICQIDDFEDWVKILRFGDGHIEDEHGASVTYDNFMAMVAKNQNQKHHNNFQGCYTCRFGHDFYDGQFS